MSIMPETSFHRSEQEFFDRLVADRGNFDVFSSQGWEHVRNNFETLLGKSDGVRVLDIGCGTGSSRRVYQNVATEYTGLDLSVEAIELARSQQPDANWVVGNAEDLPFENGTFDVVAFSSVLHHLPSIPAALGEARRVIKNGGFCFAFDPNLLNPAMFLLRYPKSPFYIKEGVSPNECPITAATVRRAFLAVSFRDVRVCATSIEFKCVKPKLVNYALPAYRIFERVLDSARVNRVFGTFLLTSARVPG